MSQTFSKLTLPVAGSSCFKRAAVDPSTFGETLQADHQWISRKGRRARVGGIAVAYGTQRQDLPQRLFRFGQEVEKLIGSRTEIADAASRRERCWMQKYAGGARVHGLV